MKRGIMNSTHPRSRRRGVIVSIALLAAVLAALVTLGYASPDVTAADSQAPTNTAPPTVSDTTPQAEQTVTATEGTWTGDQPQTTAFQWQRCNAGGANCVAIPAANDQTYTGRVSGLSA
jgi:hypothetical protein